MRGRRGDSRCRGAIRAAGPGDRGARARGARGRSSPARRRPISRSFCAAARTSCAPCCRAAISAARASPLIALVAVVIWGFSGFFRVDPDELGVVLRFGKYVRDAKPGLNYHLPYPIESALTPKVTRVNRIDIGMRSVDDLRRGSRQPRRAGGKPDADRRREHRRCRFLGVLADQARRRRRLSVQHPAARGHREGGRRKRHARGGRPLRDPADPHRRARRPSRRRCRS